jgi:ubiquinone/menaquinone biosynthesis C-methylase UbiE
VLKISLKNLTTDFQLLFNAIESLNSGDILEFELLDKEIDFKALVDVAQILYCKLLSPKIVKDSCFISFRKLHKTNSFHNSKNDVEEKYGVESSFATIDKISQPSFILHYLKALQSVNIDTRKRVLNLGVNSGEEFQVIKEYSKSFSNLEFVGIDYCPSAIEKAKDDFKEDRNTTFLQADINKLEELDLGKFDLIITIGTLQSTNIDFNKTFMNIVQNYLKKDGAMILGFPNCRWIDGEMIYGARVKNYNYSELSNLYKDVNFCKKYLQQKKFRVTITGKDYIFLTATSIK